MQSTRPNDVLEHTPARADSALALPYAPQAGVFDWMREGGGQTRPGWEQLEALLAAGGPSDLESRYRQAQRLIHRNGVTYNVYADPRGLHRPWAIDPIPLVIGAEQWSPIERGLEQRARLLDALLRDLYGPQRVVREGLLPAELVFANPGYLRPCRGIVPADRPMLVLYAAELVRGADGCIRVNGDRTQAPSGAGYALENRLALTQTWRAAYRAQPVLRLASFFRDYRDMLRALSPTPRDNPLVALLTPGPFNESYFEHSYLASYLGLTLVQGADLAVRDEHVYLKMLGGLEPVDVILRRIDDSYCDPLSLRSESALGVPGLVHAVRAGNVVVANALGTGVIDTRAIIPYLPAIARALLAEDLQLPSVETYWCGDAEARGFVADHLDELVVRPTFADGRRAGRVVVAALSAERRQELRRAIEADPAAYVAQRDPGLATAPTWADGGMVPRPVGLRAFAAWQEGSYEVLPGGLVRVASQPGSTDLSMQQGSGSKDCWVLTDGPVSKVSLLHRSGHPLAVSRAGDDLPSRAADDLFWLGRYAERADALARLMRTLAVTLGELGTVHDASPVPVLVHALGIQTQLECRLAIPRADAELEDLERGLVAFLMDPARGRSLRNTIARAHQAAVAVRDRIGHDALPALQRAADVFGERQHREPSLGLADVLELLDELLVALAAFSGMGFEGLTRGHGYRFADMGRRLERAYATSRLLWSTLIATAGDEVPLLFSLLRVLDSTGAFRRRYRGAIEAAPVVDLLVFDERNPRSVAFQLAALAEHTAGLPYDRSRPQRRAEDRRALAALTRLRLLDAETVSVRLVQGVRTELEAMLDATANDMTSLSDDLTRSYFIHAIPRHSLS